MRLFPLAGALLLMIANSIQIEKLEDVLVYPVEPALNIRKREVSDSTKNKQNTGNFKEFVEEKLIQHTQALEYLVKLVQENEETTQRLLENLSNNVEKPKLPEKVEVYGQRMRNKVVTDESDHPIVRLGKNVTKYGMLVGNILLKEIRNDTEPIPLVEKDQNP